MELDPLTMPPGWDVWPKRPNADAVRAARKFAKLTQAEAARMIHVSARTWQKWEAGDSRMQAGLWQLFCEKARTHMQTGSEETE